MIGHHGGRGSAQVGDVVYELLGYRAGPRPQAECGLYTDQGLCDGWAAATLLQVRIDACRSVDIETPVQVVRCHGECASARLGVVSQVCGTVVEGA
ncbi:hypothetical protein RERY_02770 [Rhodococcus erythropolis]|nr:hypothetical protein RERY_02770 [Rhodococcus erythropolis]